VECSLGSEEERGAMFHFWQHIKNNESSQSGAFQHAAEPRLWESGMHSICLAW
jgi:hypothetical protein